MQSRATLPASYQSFMSEAAICDASVVLPRHLDVPDADYVLCAALIEGLLHVKIKHHEIIKLSTSAIDGCEVVDQAAIKRCYPVVRSVLVHCKFKLPSTPQLATAFASVDNTGGHILSGQQSARGRLQWATCEAERCHFVLSYVMRLCRRAKTSRSIYVNQLKLFYKDALAHRPSSKPHVFSAPVVTDALVPAVTPVVTDALVPAVTEGAPIDASAPTVAYEAPINALVPTVDLTLDDASDNDEPWSDSRPIWNMYSSLEPTAQVAAQQPVVRMHLCTIGCSTPCTFGCSPYAAQLKASLAAQELAKPKPSCAPMISDEHQRPRHHLSRALRARH
jgi:hypothetical protein